MNEIPTVLEEKRIIDMRDRAKHIPVARPEKYNICRPGDEKFEGLPLEQRWERVLKIQKNLENRLEKIKKIRAGLRSEARKKGMVL